jgi:predicted nucleic acid-binding Zn ribbon protein
VPWRSDDDHDDEPRPIGPVVDRFVRQVGGVPAASLEAIFSHWEDAVGASVAAHTAPLSLRDGTLVVAVDNPAWATQLRLLHGELIGRLAAVAGAGAVTRFEVRVRPGKAAPEGPPNGPR